MSDTLAALAVALSGGLGGFAGAALTTSRNLRATDRTQRREQLRRDGETLGPIYEYLAATNPERLHINAAADPDDSFTQYEALKERRDHLMTSLQVMASGHPDAKVRGQARKLSTALFNALVSAGWGLRDNPRTTRRDASARADHEEALLMLEELGTLTVEYGN